MTYIKKIRTTDGDLQIDYEALANLPVSDTTLTLEGSFADAKATGDKFNKIEQEKIGQAQLTNAVNTALETAKASGDFKGDKGDSGVYVGSGTMPDGYNIQIDPNDDQDIIVSREEFEQLQEEIVDLKETGGTTGTGLSDTLRSALKTYFTNMQTLLTQLAYTTEEHMASTLVENAQAVVTALGEVTVSKSGTKLTISGVDTITTVSQSGNTLVLS